MNPVETYVASLEEGPRRGEVVDLIDLMSEVTGEKAMMSGENTVGFGSYHYRYASGQEGDFFKIGFSSRKDRLTIYVMSGLRGFEDILARLGRHQTGKSTVHVRRLEDVDRSALVDLVRECVIHIDSVVADLGAIPRMKDIPPRTA